MSRRMKQLKLDVVVVDMHVDIFSFRQHRHGSSGRVNASRSLRLRDTLDTVDATLELEELIASYPKYREDNFLKPPNLGWVTRDDLYLKAMLSCEVRVHAKQISGKQRRFVATDTSPDLDDDILVVIRVFGNTFFLDLSVDSFQFPSKSEFVLFDHGSELGIRSLCEKYIIVSKLSPQRFFATKQLEQRIHRASLQSKFLDFLVIDIVAQVGNSLVDLMNSTCQLFCFQAHRLTAYLKGGAPFPVHALVDLEPHGAHDNVLHNSRLHPPSPPLSLI